MSTTHATLTRRTTTTYTLALAPCARCGRLCAPATLVPATPVGEWRCGNLGACADHRAERARIAAALRAATPQEAA